MCPQNTLRAPSNKSLLQQVRDKAAKTGLQSLDDYKIICLVINIGGGYCKYCKHADEVCLKRNRSLREFVSASPEELDPECRTCKAREFAVEFLQEVPKKYLEERITHKSFLKSSQEVFDYLYYSMRDLKKELFKVIYLNRRNQIIEIVDLFQGTLETIPIAPREIMENALKRSASAMIFAHNHPSGDPAPSKSDKQLTRDLVFIGMVMQIKVLDHIIIGDNQHFSFADEGLIEKYEDDFLNLRIARQLNY